jgi:hypothetical protein
MNLSGIRKSIKGQRGFTVMEVLAYVILFVAFLSFAYRAVSASSRGIGSLQNNAYDIIRVTSAGERWRQDIREAVSIPVVTEIMERDQSFSNFEHITREDGVEGLGIDGNSTIPDELPIIPAPKPKEIKVANIKIQKGSKTIWYIFRQGKVYRKNSLTPDNLELVLKNVATSTMTSEQRGAAVAWRWELELKVTREAALTRPLFSFLAVSEKGQKP